MTFNQDIDRINNFFPLLPHSFKNRFLLQFCNSRKGSNKRQCLSSKCKREKYLFHEPHYLSPSGNCRNRITVCQPLSKSGQVRGDSKIFLSTTVGIAKPGDCFIKNKHCSIFIS